MKYKTKLKSLLMMGQIHVCLCTRKSKHARVRSVDTLQVYLGLLVK